MNTPYFCFTKAKRLWRIELLPATSCPSFLLTKHRVCIPEASPNPNTQGQEAARLVLSFRGDCRKGALSMRMHPGHSRVGHPLVCTELPYQMRDGWPSTSACPLLPPHRLIAGTRSCTIVHTERAKALPIFLKSLGH